MEKGKISINIGNLSINYEGSEKFIKEDFNNLFNLEEICRILKDDITEIKKVKRISKKKKTEKKRKASKKKKTEKKRKASKKKKTGKKQKKVKKYDDLLSVLKVDNVDDLIIGSLGYYYFMKKVESVSYRDLYNLMKTHKEYIGQFKNALTGLVDSNRILLDNEKYSLNDKEVTKLGKKLKGYF